MKEFPIRFTLESGTEVAVHKNSAGSYDFALVNSDGINDNFTYVPDNRSREEVENTLDFDQLNALRAFWLKQDEVI